MRPLTSLLAGLFVLFAASRSAYADLWAIVPAAAPSTAHPKGTVIVFGAGAVERDVASGKALRTSGPLFKLGPTPVSSVVAGGETFVASGAGVNGDTTDEIALWVIGSDLRPRERIALGHGEEPTLVAGGSWLAVGFYEWRAPVKTFKEWAPQYVYRVLLLDRASRKVVAQKVYGEPSNLCPRTFVEDHMLVIAGGRLFVSLPLPHHAHLVAASLPSLTTLAETDLAHDALFGSMRIAWYGDRLVAIGPKWIELSSDLGVLAERPWVDTAGPIRVAIDGTAVLLDGAPPRGVSSARRAKTSSTEHIAWAWGTPLALGHRGDADAPIELVVVP